MMMQFVVSYNYLAGEVAGQGRKKKTMNQTSKTKLTTAQARELKAALNAPDGRLGVDTTEATGEALVRLGLAIRQHRFLGQVRDNLIADRSKHIYRARLLLSGDDPNALTQSLYREPKAAWIVAHSALQSALTLDYQLNRTAYYLTDAGRERAASMGAA
jgi:hypothetical protein